ncbi:glycosyltransferase family 4 protein [Priestia megaterium]|uniref:glycosyltransferase family 4 protein n=1 Tax=Priestia megaterium TaxID=1404 RepID=UPI00300A35F1
MKILYVTTISNTANAFLIPHIKMLINQGHQVDLAFNIAQEVDTEIFELGCKVHELEFERSPLNSQNYTAYKKLKKLIYSEKYDLIHTHTPVASACVRLASRKFKEVKVVYTAHGFHFFKGAPLINWLTYYLIERWLSRYTDLIITINKEDFLRAKTSFKARKIEYIPGVGIDTNKYNSVTVNKHEKLREIGIPNDAFIILSVGELNNNKNHATILRAITKLNNPNIYYVVCGKGPLENYLRDLTNKLGINNQVKLLGYRTDIAEICNIADIFAFPSKREGLGLAALEAMASGLPLITSNVHGIVDYSIDGKTGYTCSSADVEGFSKAIKKLVEEPETCLRMGKENLESVKKFGLNNVLKILERVYNESIFKQG